MKIPAGINKWGSAGLAAVCLLLVANLVAKYREWQPVHSPVKAAVVSASPAPSDKGPSQATQDLLRYDSTIHFDVLKKLDSRPLPDADRNPFDYVGGAGPIAPSGTAVPQRAANAPPPPPPPPIKAVGYNELPGGKKEAMVTYNEDLVVVHEGDMVGNKFKVLKIDPTVIVVEDGESHKTIELPLQ